VLSSWRYHVRNGLRRLGLDVARVSPTVPATSMGYHVSQLFDRLEVDCVIDVGARIGDYGRWLRHNGYRGRIVSVEPVRDNFLRLARVAADDPLWTAHRFALGSAESTMSINVSSDTSFSSLLTPNEYAKNEFAHGPAVVAQELVDVRRLDDVWPTLVAGASSVFLKMDTQGWDGEVLAGASGVLDRVRGVQTEVSVKPIYDGMTPWTQSIQRLEGLGYELSGLFPVNLDRRMRVIEFDCVALRPEFVRREPVPAGGRTVHGPPR
jgi:FkbM family methyltransferase